MASKKPRKAVYTETHKHDVAARARSTSATKVSTKPKKEATAQATRRDRLVRDVMTPHVIAVTSVTFLPEAAKIMCEEDVGALPVVQEDGQLVGIITDRDITVRCVASGQDVSRTRVAECYTTEDLVTVTPDVLLHDAEALMAEHHVRRLPIVQGDNNRLVGMVSLADIARVADRHDASSLLKDVSKPFTGHSQACE